MTDKINLDNFYSGGYFLVRLRKHGWEQLSKDLLPEQIISLSECLSEKLNVSWGWPTGNKQHALDFGISTSKLDEFVEWCHYHYSSEMDMWGIFHSTDAARRFIKRFLLDTQNLLIIGTGLPHELEEKYWREDKLEEVYGIEKRIEQRLPLEDGGQVLGFEVVNFEYGNYGHSWLYSYFHENIYKLSNIRPNKVGLIATEEEAQKIYRWINEDDLRGERTGHEPYDYWLLVSYPL